MPWPSIKRLTIAALLTAPALAAAQLGLPTLPPVDLGGTVRDAAGLVRLDQLAPGQLARTLADARLDRLNALVRENRRELELDGAGNPAVRGVLVASGIDAATVARAEAAGFRVVERVAIAGLDLAYVRFAVPEGQSLKRAQKTLAGLAAGAEIAADNIYFASGQGATASTAPAPSSPAPGRAIGIIDGGIAAHPSLTGRIEQRGFAPGAPTGSAHGTAVASLIAGSGTVRGAAPGASLLAADVYGQTSAGGNVTAIARALGWMAERRVPVVTVSLVGPDNPLLRAAVRAAQGKGVVIVAAVGNDGPAAPPAFPASLPGVIAVTGVGANGRALPEAGRALHVDFAAPGATKAAGMGGRVTAMRGTSFTAPLVAGRLFAHYPAARVDRVQPSVAALIAEARDLGKKGRDPVYGHGLVCGDCATR